MLLLLLLLEVVLELRLHNGAELNGGVNWNGGDQRLVRAVEERRTGAVEQRCVWGRRWLE